MLDVHCIYNKMFIHSLCSFSIEYSCQQFERRNPEENYFRVNVFLYLSAAAKFYLEPLLLLRFSYCWYEFYFRAAVKVTTPDFLNSFISALDLNQKFDTLVAIHFPHWLEKYFSKPHLFANLILTSIQTIKLDPLFFTSFENQILYIYPYYKLSGFILVFFSHHFKLHIYKVVHNFIQAIFYCLISL